MNTRTITAEKIGLKRDSIYNKSNFYKDYLNLCSSDELNNIPSLFPVNQLELIKFIEDSARFFGCQFVISTHSPFLLAIKGAKIYDLDENPVKIKPWTELENVLTYYQFFKEHNGEFLKT